MNKDLNIKLVRSLVWTVLTYGAECWTLVKDGEKSWTEHRTEQSIRKTTRQPLLSIVVLRKLSFFGHTIRDGGCELVRCAIQGKVNGKRRLGRYKSAYSSIIETSQNG